MLVAHRSSSPSGRRTTGSCPCVRCSPRVAPMARPLTEEAHFARIVKSFDEYRDWHTRRLMSKLQFCQRMPAHQRQRLVPYCKHLDSMLACVESNGRLMSDIVRGAEFMFENKCVGNSGVEVDGDCEATKPRPIDMEKTACVLRQIVREWTRHGAPERQQSFGLILEAVDRYFGSLGVEAKRETRILVPGAGLGRLACDLAKRGFATEGNEYSMFMLLASHFILNQCRGTNVRTFFPFVHQLNNVLHSANQTESMTFPDDDPSDVPHDVPFSMTAGSFIDVYSGPEFAGHFQAIVTCFFIDTTHNLLDYVQTIRHALHDNGLWINLGPLLYHYADMPGEESIEPSYDLIKDIIHSYGFQMREERVAVPCSYTQNPDSMLSYVYRCVFFVAVKRPSDAVTST